MANYHGRSIGPHRYDEAQSLILQGRTAAEIASLLDVDPETVRKFARKRGLTVQRQDMSMAKHPSWTGGMTQDRAGYLLQRVDAAGEFGYLIRSARRGDRRGYAPIHRIVMHEKLGRRLLPDEVVHHKDDDVQNNDPSNLSVYPTNADHLRDTLAGRTPQWSEEGFARMCAPRPDYRRKGSEPDATHPPSRSDDPA